MPKVELQLQKGSAIETQEVVDELRRRKVLWWGVVSESIWQSGEGGPQCLRKWFWGAS